MTKILVLAMKIIAIFVVRILKRMKNRFQWISDGVEAPRLNFEKIEMWIESVTKAHDRILGPLTYIFCNDEKIIEVNRQFLNHDYFTDIITFDYSRGKLISGDMFISLDTVLTNSEIIGATYDEELLRVIVHGVLHLCGINDKGPGEREIMEQEENKALAMFN